MLNKSTVGVLQTVFGSKHGSVTHHGRHMIVARDSHAHKAASELESFGIVRCKWVERMQAIVVWAATQPEPAMCAEAPTEAPLKNGTPDPVEPAHAVEEQPKRSRNLINGTWTEISILVYADQESLLPSHRVTGHIAHDMECDYIQRLWQDWDGHFVVLTLNYEEVYEGWINVKRQTLEFDRAYRDAPLTINVVKKEG